MKLFPFLLVALEVIRGWIKPAGDKRLENEEQKLALERARAAELYRKELERLAKRTTEN